jgi:hypothetical protein
MENVGIFYDHLEYIIAIWYNLWTFGIVCGHLVYSYHFGMFAPRKIWQLWYTHTITSPIHNTSKLKSGAKRGEEKKKNRGQKNPLEFYTHEKNSTPDLSFLSRVTG